MQKGCEKQIASYHAKCQCTNPPSRRRRAASPYRGEKQDFKNHEARKEGEVGGRRSEVRGEVIGEEEAADPFSIHNL